MRQKIWKYQFEFTSLHFLMKGVLHHVMFDEFFITVLENNILQKNLLFKHAKRAAE